MQQSAPLPARPGTDLPAPDLADKIPLSSRVVLDLGCGDGAVGAEFRRRNPAALLIGIERDPERARRASSVLDRVYCLDLEAGLLPRLGAAPDCILFSPGVMERLEQPREVLEEFARLLAPGGVLVLCTPHGAHWVGPQSRLLTDAGLYPMDAEEVSSGSLQPATRTIWRAATAPVERLRVFSTMLPPVGGVSQVRVVEPLLALAAQPAVATQITNRLDLLPEVGPDPGIFVLHRPALLGAEGLDTIRQLIGRGWLVVCEFDDHPSQIPILHRSDVQNFRAVHAIQTSTPALAEVLARENPEVAVFPNAISRVQEPCNFAAAGRMTLLFAALNREDDWPGHVEALNDAAAAAGDALHFHVIADRAFFTALTTPHKTFTALCDYPTYLDILSRCEISFMPLRDTLFNRCKSDLKFLEAASRRVVALASPVVYGESIEDGVNGLLFRDAAELHDRLMRLVAAPQMACALAGRAWADVTAGRMLAHQVARRDAWYRGLWSRRDALHRALLRRVPELEV